MKASLYNIKINIKNPDISFLFYKDLLLYLGYEVISEEKDYIEFTDKVNNILIMATDFEHSNLLLDGVNTRLSQITFIIDSKEKIDQFYKEFLMTKNVPILYDSTGAIAKSSCYSISFMDPDGIKLELIYKIDINKIDKNLLGWHKKKIEIIQKQIIPDFNQRDIWWCSIGLNIGYEEDGKNNDFERPVLILKKFSKDVFIGLPLTSIRKESPYYFPCSIHGEDGSIIISHPRLLSSKRLNRRLLKIGRGIFKEITNKYISLFAEIESPT